MYQNIKSCVASEGKLSDFFVSNVGVRQGENLSPLLFTIYVDDLENYLSANGSVPLEVDKMFNTENVLKLLVLLYAHDTLILADSPENLQKSLHNLSLYCEKWHLTVNEKKTKIMIFSKRKFKKRSTFYYANKKVEIVQNFKYFGIVFSFNGKNIACMKDITTRAQRAMFSILKKSRVLNLPIDIQ